jgi:hypothetical protein
LTNYQNISYDNNNKNKEEKNFIELSNNKNIFNFFDYIFLDHKTIRKDFCNIVRFDISNSFCLNLKKNCRIKIICYFNDFLLNESEDKTFFILTDFFIFKEKNNTINIFNKMNEKEGNYNFNKYKVKKNDNTKKEKFKNKLILHSNDNNLFHCSNNNSNNSKYKIIYRNEASESNEMKYSIEKKNINKSILEFLNEKISKEKNEFILEDKLIFILEELKETILLLFTKREKKPFIYDFKLKIIPDTNIHNIDEINEYKNIIKNNSEIYSLLFISGVLSELIQNKNNIENDEVFVKSFLLGNNCIKNLLIYEKKNKKFPKKEIFLTDITKTDIINFDYIPPKESRFILDGNDINIKKTIYNPLLDKCSQTYFTNEVTREIIMKNGLIDEKGNLFYDKIYKDSLGMNPKYKKNRYSKDRRSIDDIYLMNALKGIKCKEIENNINEIIKNKYIIDQKITGYNKKVYQYSIYSNAMKKKLLPKIKLKRKYNTFKSLSVDNNKITNLKI